MISSLLEKVFSLLNGFTGEVALLLVAIVFGVVLAPIYGLVSSQRAIKRAKGKITAGMYEAVLFRRALRVSLWAQAKMMWAGVQYFLLAIPPILILAIPGFIILSYCNLYFGYESPGQQVLVKGVFKDRSAISTASIVGPQNLKVAEVKVNSMNSVLWRISRPEDGTKQDDIRLKTGGMEFPLNIKWDPKPGFTYAYLSQSFLESLAHPSPKELPEELSTLELQYPEKVYRYFNFELSWIVAFLLISIAAGYIASRIFGVEI